MLDDIESKACIVPLKAASSGALSTALANNDRFVAPRKGNELANNSENIDRMVMDGENTALKDLPGNYNHW